MKWLVLALGLLMAACSGSGQDPDIYPQASFHPAEVGGNG